MILALVEQTSNVADVLSTADRWSLLVGAAMPLVIAVVNRYTWPSWLKLLCAVVLSVAAAAVTVYVQGAWNPHDFVGSVILVLFSAFFTYLVAWKPSGIAGRLEQAT